MPTALEALATLKEGNRRFVEGVDQHVLDALAHRREAFAGGQAPAAVVLGCSDSRVPPEIIFDQGLGELFVIRVAGNIASPSQVGSVEFAVQVLGVRLVVVLGHTSCGAVSATLDALLQPDSAITPGMASIVDVIRPALAPVVAEGSAGAEPMLRAAVEANVRASVAELRTGLSGARPGRGDEADPVLVVGAVYDVDTGSVDFLAG